MPTNVVIMVLGIVLISTIGRLYAAKHGLSAFRSNRREMRYRMRNDLMGNTEPQSDPEADRMRDEIKTLKERIAVLERIATDGRSAADLEREIEKLR